MTRDRILTALLLIPLAVAAILLLPTPWLAAIFALFTLIGGWEWGRLAGIDSPVVRALYAALTIPPMIAAYLYPELLAGGSLALFGLISALWALVGVWLLVLVKGPLEPRGGGVAIKALAGLVVLLPAWWACVRLHAAGEAGAPLLLFLMVLIWAGDSAAYFAGRRFGDRKLAPVVSPGKSIEGALGAMVAAVILALALAWWQPALGLFAALLLCLAVMGISIVGDLFESFMKRRAGLKDSGNLLPGHGGVLDRIDSLTAAAPLYLFLLLLLGVVR